MRISVHRMMSTCKPRIRNLQWSKSETFGALSCECLIKVQTGSLYKYPGVMEAPDLNVLCPGISGQWQPGAGEGCVLQLDELMTASVWGNISQGTAVLQSKVYFARVLKKVLFFFFFRDLRKFKDAKKQFEKVSEEKENALVKNAQVQRNKQHEVEEATNILTATRKCFRHIALDYVLQVRPRLVSSWAVPEEQGLWMIVLGRIKNAFPLNLQLKHLKCL